MLGRKSLIDKAVRRRFVVTLASGEGAFSGVLTESDVEIWVFEACKTSAGEDIAGRVFVDRLGVAYLQELS